MTGIERTRIVHSRAEGYFDIVAGVRLLFSNSHSLSALNGVDASDYTTAAEVGSERQESI